MADPKEVKQLIAQAVADALQSRLETLQKAVAEEVASSIEPVLEELKSAHKHESALEQEADDKGKKLEKLEADLEAAEKERDEAKRQLKKVEAELDEAHSKKTSAPAYEQGTGPTDILNAAVASIFDAGGQSDILRVLLDGLSQFAERAALFVHKGGNLVAWQCRGFPNEAKFKGVTLNGTEGLAGRAIQDKEPVSAAAAEFDSAFIKTHGNPADGNALVLPLVVREKVAAVLYTDGGQDEGGKNDQSSLRVLVRSAASWLEILALRKAGAGTDTAEPEAASAAPPPPAPPAAPAAIATAAAAAAAPAAGGPDLAGLSAADQEVHKKAKRFAKLLVDEIKLYNQAKVAEGRQNNDLYQRLKEDIDKSRATYDKRYASTVAASAGYFTQEVIRILADNDAAVLGSGFSQ